MEFNTARTVRHYAAFVICYWAQCRSGAHTCLQLTIESSVADEITKARQAIRPDGTVRFACPTNISTRR